MYVICDIEWVSNLKCKLFPTQIAAVKVSKRWNIISCFGSLICPPIERKYSKNNVAFNGGEYSDFYAANSAQDVFESFYRWLDSDDVLVWWYDKSDEIFRNHSLDLLPEHKQNESIIICEYLKTFLQSQDIDVSNQYALAEKLQIDTSHYEKHISMHDAIVICEVLKKVKYPQDALGFPSDIKGMLPVALQRFSSFPYYYDKTAELLHDCRCSKLIDVSVNAIGYPNFDKSIRNGYKPCDCCKDEFKKVIVDRNEETIKRNRFNYVFSKESGVFHKNDCRVALNARSIKGTRTLEAVLKTGRKPCKICNPPSKVERFNNVVKSTYAPKLRHIKNNMSTKNSNLKDNQVSLKLKSPPFIATKEEMRAVNRQKVAARERSDKLRDGLSQDELNNIYALTQPRYAFWAAKGHKHFHLRSCPTMKNLSHLRGFETYQDAIRARFVPCRQCKPSSKHDLKLSIPIYNQLRENESINDLKELCKTEGFESFVEESMLHIITSVGKWKVHGDSIPIRVEHINLKHDPDETKYHNQHRLFLSFTDVFKYIKQHDENLIELQPEIVVQ